MAHIVMRRHKLKIVVQYFRFVSEPFIKRRQSPKTLLTNNFFSQREYGHAIDISHVLS